MDKKRSIIFSVILAVCLIYIGYFYANFSETAKTSYVVTYDAVLHYIAIPASLFSASLLLSDLVLKWGGKPVKIIKSKHLIVLVVLILLIYFFSLFKLYSLIKLNIIDSFILNTPFIFVITGVLLSIGFNGGQYEKNNNNN